MSDFTWSEFETDTAVQNSGQVWFGPVDVIHVAQKWEKPENQESSH